MSNFQLAMAFTSWAEKGYVVDDGGPTYMGFTQTTYDGYRDRIGAPRQDVRLITQSEVQTIATQEYWLPAHCQDLPVKLSVCQFDCCFNSGETEATRILQRTLGFPEDDVDGDYGPFTHAAVLSCDDAHASNAYLDARWEFMQKICANEPPTKRLDGYRNRISNLRAYLAKIGG